MPRQLTTTKTSHEELTHIFSVSIVIILLCKKITASYDHIMYSKMTAYRKKHSCETALISWVEDWRLALDNKQKALLLSMDMSKAFDLVLPSLTVAKLGAYGFNDKSLQLMRSYFKDRLNRVKVGKATSDLVQHCGTCTKMIYRIT